MPIDDIISEQNPLNEEGKVLLLKESLETFSSPAFLCRVVPYNPHFLEIIECNNLFLQCFDLEKDQVIGNNYDFLLQDENTDYGSASYLEYANLIKAVKSLKAAEIKVNIFYPNDHSRSDYFKISFLPSRYKTQDIYCNFIFEKTTFKPNQHLEGLEYQNLIQNLERALRNERILRSVSDMIASDPNLKEVAHKVSKILCQYLKVDRCIVYDHDNNDSGFWAEYCGSGVKRIVNDDKDLKNKSTAAGRYVEFQNTIFADINSLKKSNTTTIYQDIKNDVRFGVIRDVCQEFGIGSQIVVIMTSENAIIGGLYVQQSESRSWLLEEIELIEIVASEFAMAIDRLNYTQKLLISNQGLVEKTAQLAKALKQEKKMRELQSEFVALVSHEFKTPLQIIDGARELASRKIKSLNIIDEYIDKSFERIKSAIARMNNLIQSNLSLAKVEMSENGIEINRQNFELKKLINDIVEKNSNLAVEKHINVEFDIAKLPDIYNGDSKLLDHSFTNMIGNAIKYSKNNSTVKIFGQIENDKLLIKVQDSGIGIPADDLARIGSKFFRAKNTLSVAGTGIGLYLTKYFIELHKGSLLIESELDVGTTITASLPVN